MFSAEHVQASLASPWSQAEPKEEEGKDPEEAADNSRQHQQRQINLLDHIDAVQDEVSHRMDFIERELDGKLDKKFYLFMPEVPQSSTKAVKSLILVT